MTKELLLALGWFDGPTETRTFHEHDLIKFFTSNVIVSRGDNRHPDADAVHEWLEDTTKSLQYHREGKWYTDYPFGTATRYRIKPQEPIFEWQWYIIINGKVYTTSHDFRDKVKEFMTEDEIINASKGYFDYKSWKKIPETKRERK
jgi:hypothetical protein